MASGTIKKKSIIYTPLVTNGRSGTYQLPKIYDSYLINLNIGGTGVYETSGIVPKGNYRISFGNSTYASVNISDNEITYSVVDGSYSNTKVEVYGVDI